MLYLHENREEFMNVINLLSEYFRVLPIIVENEYQLDVSRRDIIETFFDGEFGIKLDEDNKLLKMNF
ncbi:hypothetical protein [Enterococcus cecorum]|uniref:hypothetical protein n=1 Tax=Enterococcus cecorum TaxID=44008 RepID=UPI00200A6234|nr:hypothetical protein [Enterococcus cecorum]